VGGAAHCPPSVHCGLRPPTATKPPRCPYVLHSWGLSSAHCIVPLVPLSHSCAIVWLYQYTTTTIIVPYQAQPRQAARRSLDVSRLVRDLHRRARFIVPHRCTNHSPEIDNCHDRKNLLFSAATGTRRVCPLWGLRLLRSLPIVLCGHPSCVGLYAAVLLSSSQSVLARMVFNRHSRLGASRAPPSALPRFTDSGEQ
jgi:hypothetical protein